MLSAYEVSYYAQFQCIAGACTNSCCYGWRIPVDRESRARYAKEPGLLGLRLQLALRGKETPMFNAHSFDCPFHNRKRLCALQLAKGADFMPEICRNYPRIQKNYGLFAERFLDVACVHAAAMFLRNRDRLYLTETEAFPADMRDGTNEDYNFLRRLVASREGLIALLRPVSSLPQAKRVFCAILHYAESAQKACVEEAYEFFDREGNTPAGFLQREAAGEAISLFPLPIDPLNRLMSTSFFHPKLRTRSPFLYRLCRLYYRKFDRLTEAAGQREYNRLLDAFFYGRPERVQKYTDYFIYDLYVNYLETFEDYSFVRRILYGLIHINMLLLFDLLYAERYGEPTQEAEAEMISIYARRTCHNDEIIKAMYGAVAAYIARDPYADSPF